MEKRPVAGLLVTLEEREVDHPVEEILVRREPELTIEMDAEAAEHARDSRLVAGCEERGRARLAPECLELRLGEELRDRRPHLVAVVDQVRETLGSPLLRDLLEPLQLRPRERARRDEEAHGLGSCEDAELGAARHLGRILDLEAVAQIWLVGAVPSERLRVRQARKRPCRCLSPESSRTR